MKLSEPIVMICLVTLIGLQNVGWAEGMMSKQDQELLRAAGNNDTTTVGQLLHRGARVETQDVNGRTALLVAVDRNHLETAKLLIDAGADVNAQDHQLDSPLLLAGARGYVGILKLILNAKPDFRVYNRFGGTALIPACERGHVDTVKTLLETEVDIDHVNHLGWTALLEAIILSDGGSRHQEIVRLLIKAGADLNLPDGEGITPLQHARTKGYTTIVDMLESAGAR